MKIKVKCQFFGRGGFEGQKFMFSVLLGTYSRKTFEDKKSNGEVIFLPLGVTIGVKSKFFGMFFDLPNIFIRNASFEVQNFSGLLM